jgi:hypothetical protein
VNSISVLSRISTIAGFPINAAVVIAVAFGFATPVWAQGYGYLQTPEIQLGGDLTPTIVKIPEVITETQGETAAPLASEAAPANPELLANIHFDYIVAPEEKVMPGSLEDTSISLGEYARQLRAGNVGGEALEQPGAMASPAERAAPGSAGEENRPAGCP